MEGQGDTFILDFEGERYTMTVAKAKEMLAYLEGLLDEASIKEGLPEFIHAIRVALADRKN
jgi:hypothetical protein